MIWLGLLAFLVGSVVVVAVCARALGWWFALAVWVGSILVATLLVGGTTMFVMGLS